MFGLFCKKKESIVDLIPDGWIVYELGQNPVHMLWYCQLIEEQSMFDGDEYKSVFVEEYDTPEMALNVAKNRVLNGDIFIKKK